MDISVQRSQMKFSRDNKYMSSSCFMSLKSAYNALLYLA